MKTNHELFEQMSTCTRTAARMVAGIVNNTEPLDRATVASVRSTLQLALCAATSLESLMAGNPAPKEG